MAIKATRRDVMRERGSTGRAKPTHKEDPRFPTMWRRIKDHGAALGIHPYVGTVLGRLSLSGRLLDHQVQAGFRVAEIVGAYDRLCSGARPYTCASPAYQRGFGSGPTGSDTTIDATERRAKSARKKYEKLFGARGCVPNATAEALVIQVCIENREPGSAHHNDLSTLLGVIAARLGIQDASRAPKVSREAPPAPKQQRACAILCEALLEAIEQDFRVSQAVPAEFALDRNDPGNEHRGIVVFGSIGAGAAEKPYHHAAAVERGGFLAAEIDAALLELALARGWTEREGASS